MFIALYVIVFCKCDVVVSVITVIDSVVVCRCVVCLQVNATGALDKGDVLTDMHMVKCVAHLHESTCWLANQIDAVARCVSNAGSVVDIVSV